LRRAAALLRAAAAALLLPASVLAASPEAALSGVVEAIAMFRYPGEADFVVVTFVQDYRSSNLANAMRKRQYWQKQDGRWRILYEGAA